MRTFLRRVWYAIRCRRLEAELAGELEFHRLMKQQELEARGLDPDSAALEARRAIGNVLLAREHVRDVWIWPWLTASI